MVRVLTPISTVVNLANPQEMDSKLLTKRKATIHVFLAYSILLRTFARSFTVYFLKLTDIFENKNHSVALKVES
jgi:hypothetical protein